MWLQEGRKHHYPLKNKCFLFSSIFIFHSLSTTAQLRCNFKQTQPPWPPVWFSPVSTLYSLDQRLKKWGLAQWSACKWSVPAVPGTPLAVFSSKSFSSMPILRALTGLVYSPVGFTLCFLHFQTVCSEQLRWPLVWEHLSSVPQWELEPWCFHILPFSAYNSDIWMNIGQGNCCHFYTKTAALSRNVPQENMHVWSAY